MRLKTTVWTVLVTIAAAASSVAQSGVPQPPSRASINANYGKLPLTFEANRGQTDPRAAFVSRGPGYTAFLTSDGMVLSLSAKQAVASPATAHAGSGSSSTHATLQFRLLGAARNPAIVGEVPQVGHVNYFIGNDPAKWWRNVPTYAQVRYRNIYPGIDLLYYGNHRQLEYDFAISPGANPERIQFEIRGAREIHIATDGALVLATSVGEIHFQTPIIYQESNGQRNPVQGSYVVKDSTHIGFQLSHYDTNKPLVIDPVLVYSTYLGGSGSDQPSGIALDTAGNVYVAGSTDSTDFPLTTLGSLPAGNTHVFVAKLDASGSNLIFADYLGGNNQDYGYAVALDAANNVYVTGSTASSDFPTVNPFQGTYPGGFNVFLSKVSPDGSSLLYSTYFGGNGSDVPSSVAVDGAGEMLIAGYTSSTTLPVANAYQSTVSANLGGMFGNYGFLTKFNPDGLSLAYSTYFGGSSNVPLNCGGTPCWPQPLSSIAGMVLDNTGNAYVTGTTNTYDFPVTGGAYLATDTTQQNATVGFVSKFNGAGSLQYSTYLYESSGLLTNINAIAVDALGSAYVTGTAISDGTFPITSTSICDPGVYGWGCSYAFVTKFDAAGASLLYSTFLGPNNNATPQAIALDGNNDAYILSSTSSSSFSPVNGIESFSSGNDILLVEIDPAASTQLFATFLGGNGNDQPAPAGMVLDASGNIYATGMTDSTDFPVIQPFQSALAGNTDAFIVKIGSGSAPAVSFSPSSLQYASQAIGSGSQPQTVLLRNMGSSSLAISSITTTGDFAETDNCGNTVPAAGSCVFSVTFTPTAAGSRTGAVVIADDAASSPHGINLSGSGLGPLASVTPASLSFSSLPVGTTSAAQTITLSNTGNLAMNITSLQIAGDYTQTNNCSVSLSPASTCAINVTFTPAATGIRNGTVTISDDATGSPQIVGLTGTGVALAAAVALTPGSLVFPTLPVGTTSTAQTLTMTNTGNAPLGIGTIAVAGDYSQTNNCPASLSAGSTCAINVIFTPTVSGTRNGTLTVTDSATGSPQTVALTGTGVVLSATVALTPGSLVFPTVTLGTTSAAQTITLGNTGNAPLSISTIAVTGDYSQANNCPASLTAGSTCSISVKFTPVGTGTRTGTVTISDSVTGSPQNSALSGTGSDFGLTSSASSATVKAGMTATYTVSVAPVGGTFANAVSLSCSGAPAKTTCGLSASSVNPGSVPATVTLTVNTIATSAELAPLVPDKDQPLLAFGMQIPGLGLFGIMLLGAKCRKHKVRAIIALIVLLAAMMFMSACAGGTGIGPQKQSGTTPGTYTITVSGTSGSLRHSLPLTLTVQ
jgi:Beta-propeller repeat/Abnormal spindle-like microcephaly-assoc'd, ASPM-SPD-2-Hydin